MGLVTTYDFFFLPTLSLLLLHIARTVKLSRCDIKTNGMCFLLLSVRINCRLPPKGTECLPAGLRLSSSLPFNAPPKTNPTLYNW